MSTSLQPLIVKSKHAFQGLYELNKTNCMVTLNAKGEFCTMTIDDTGQATLNGAAAGFPGKTGSLVSTDAANNFAWLAKTRGLYILDLNSGEKRIVNPSGITSAFISGVFLIDAAKKLFGISLYISAFSPEDAYNNYYLYDFPNDKILFTHENFSGDLLRFGDNTILYWKIVSKYKAQWVLLDAKFNELASNKLTDELNKLDLDICSELKPINEKRKILLGYKIISNVTETTFLVRWNENFEKVKTEPVVLQLPDGKALSPDFYFSSDSNWLKTLKKESDGIIEAPRLILYQVNEMYPQSLSPPIVCGYTNANNIGAFMQHSQWGPCYVEQDMNFQDKLFIYKLNEGLKMLEEQVKAGV